MSIKSTNHNDCNSLFSSCTHALMAVLGKACAKSFGDDVWYIADDYLYGLAPEVTTWLNGLKQALNNGTNVSQEFEIGIHDFIVVRELVYRISPMDLNDYVDLNETVLYNWHFRSTRSVAQLIPADSKLTQHYRVLSDLEDELVSRTKRLTSLMQSPERFLMLSLDYGPKEEGHWQNLIKGEFSEESLYVTDGSSGIKSLTADAIVYFFADFLRICFDENSESLYSDIITCLSCQPILSHHSIFQEKQIFLLQLIQVDGWGDLLRKIHLHMLNWRCDLLAATPHKTLLQYSEFLKKE